MADNVAMLRPIQPLAARVAAILTAASALGLSGCGDEPPAAAGPTCDRIAGDELARSGHWRIVRSGSGAHPERAAPVVACRTDRRGPAPVRVLGRSTGSDDDGVRVGGRAIDVVGLSGDLAVLATTDDGDPSDVEAATTERGTYTAIDLARGRAVRLPGGRLKQTDAAGNTLIDADVEVRVTPGGGLLWWTTQDGTGGGRARAGGFTRLDAGGVTPLRGVRELVPIRADRMDAFYARRSDGSAAIVNVTGAAALPRGTTPALRWRRVPLGASSPARSDEEPSGFNLEPLTDDTSDGDGPWLQWSGRGSSDPSSRLSVTWHAGSDQPIARLSGRGRAGRRTLHVLGSGPRTALLVGRFVDHPGQVRLRLISHNAAAVRFFDRVATASMQQRGHAAVAADWSASSLRITLIDGDRLLLWGPRGGRTLMVRGARDVVAGERGFFLTTGDGRARRISDVR